MRPSTLPPADGAPASRVTALAQRSSSGTMRGVSPPRTRNRLRLGLWIGVVVALAVLCVRAFVGDVYYVDSSSMEPTLHGAERGGDWVFVRYDGELQPRRFDLAVIQLPNAREPLVKRIAGLPGETLQIGDGDLFVEGRPIDASAPGRPLVELFDSERDPFEFTVMKPRWSEQAGTWKLDARGLREALASWRGHLDDGYLARDRTRVDGKRLVCDAVLELETRVEPDWKRLVLRLTEKGDVFELELTPEPTGARARVLRRTNTEKSEVLAELSLPLRAGEWHRVRWSNIDNWLALDFDGRRVATARYDANVPLEHMPDVSYQHLLPRVAFGGGELVAEFRRVRVERDLHYSNLGRHAIDAPVTLAPDEVFVLGDNSGESVDSRESGPVELLHVIGTPVWVVWPPSRWRSLGPVEEFARP